MGFSLASNSVFADNGLNVGQLFFFVFFLVLGIMVLSALVFFQRLFRLWLQAYLARAKVTFPELLGMKLRRTPVEDVVRLRIMAVQSGLSIPTSKIETAVLQGANAERAVLAMIRAREIGREVTWEEVIGEDAKERLRKQLFSE